MVQGTVGLECGGVCQLAKAVDVAHGIDVGQGGLHVLVHRDALGGVGNAYVVQIERREVGATSHGHEHKVADFLLRCLLLDIFHHLAVFLGADGTDGTTGLEVDALLLQRGAQTLGNVAVEGRQNLLAVFHYRNLTAEGIEDAGELQSYHTAAYDAQALGHLAEVEHLGGCHHSLAVCSFDGKELGHRTSGNDDVGGRVFLFAYTDGVLVHKLCLALHEGDAGCFHQCGDATCQLLHDAILACNGFGEVELHFSSLYSEGVALLEFL